MLFWRYLKQQRNQHDSGFLIAKIIVGCCLVGSFLICWLLFSVFDLPSWRIRLQGVQARSVVHIVEACAHNIDDAQENTADTYIYRYTFTDHLGEPRAITLDSTCSNLYRDGSTITIWYMPSDPAQLLTDGEFTMLVVFTACKFLAVGLLLAMFLSMLIVPHLPERREKTKRSAYRGERPGQVNLDSRRR